MGALDAISAEAREVLLEALMNVAWADRVLAEEEREVAQAAALGLGLVLPRDRDLTSPNRRPIPPEALEVERLNTRDRELIYLCAAWMALADDIEHPDETRLLERFQKRFALDDGRCRWLKARAKDLRTRQPATTAWWRAFDRLVVEAAKELNKEEPG